MASTFPIDRLNADAFPDSRSPLIDLPDFPLGKMIEGFITPKQTKPGSQVINVKDVDAFQVTIPAGGILRLAATGAPITGDPNDFDVTVYVYNETTDEFVVSQSTWVPSNGEVFLFDTKDPYTVDTTYSLTVFPTFSATQPGSYRLAIWDAKQSARPTELYQPDTPGFPKAPLVFDDGLSSTPDTFLVGKLKSGTYGKIFELGKGLDQDVIEFEAAAAGTGSVSVSRVGPGGGFTRLEFDVEAGRNTLLVRPDVPYDKKEPYRFYLTLDLDTGSVEEAGGKITRHLESKLAGLLTLFGVDGTSYLVDMAKFLDELTGGNYNQPVVSEWFGKMGDRMAALGIVVSVAGKSEKVQDVYESGGDWQRTLFSESVDYLTGALVTAGSAKIIAALGAGAAATLGLPATILLGGAVLASGVAYGNIMSDNVKATARQFYDDVIKGPVDPSVAYTPEELQQLLKGISDKVAAAAPVDTSTFEVDPDYLVLTNRDVREGYYSGKIADPVRYYIAELAEKGAPATENGGAIDPASLAYKPSDIDAGSGLTASVYDVPVRKLAGDTLSGREQKLSEAMETARGAPVTVNADLSAVANRIARDWVLNNSEGLKAVLLTEDGPDGWAGRNLAGASFTDLLADLDGLQITLPDTLEILAVRTSETDAADILDRLATVDDVLGDTSSKSFGIAEYAGLWVVIADTRNLSDDAEVSKAPVVTYANGGAGNDLVLAGSGKARTNLYEGNDVFMGGSFGDLARGGAGADELHGNGGRDKLFGNGGGDLLDGGKGNDRLIGGGGGDTIIGGAGNDKVKSGKGNDMLDTGKGRDTVKGGAGRDIIDTGKGRDTASGGGGRDVFVFEEGDGRLKIKDFSDRADKVDLTDFGFAKLADVLDKIEDTGIELVLDFGQAGRIAAQNAGALLASDGNSVLRIGEDEIMFIGITKSDFDSDDFIL